MPITVKIDADLSSLQQGTRAATDHVRQFESQTNASLKRIEQQTDRSTREVTRDLEGLNRTYQNARRSVLNYLGAYAGFQALTSFIRSTVEAGIQSERFSRTLQAATGSVGEAQRAMAFIVQTSNQLGQSIQTMVPSFVQLAAATKNTTLEGERTRALFVAITGAGQAVGLSTEGVGRAMVGLTQIISQNAIQLDEFRNQFSSQIPGAMRETARALGEMGVTATGSISEMLSLIEKQQLSVDKLMTAVTTGLERIQKAAPDMSNSVEAAFNQLRNALFQFQTDLANSGLLKLLGDITRVLGREIQGFGRAIGIASNTEVQQLQQLRDELVALGKLRQQAQQAVDQPTTADRLRGIFGESAREQVAAYDQEIESVRQRLIALDAQVRQNAATQAAADQARDAANRAAKEEEDRFFREKKARDDALKAEPARLQGQQAALMARLKQEEASIKASFDQQRRLADDYYREQLTAAPQQVAEIQAAREKDLLALAEQEQQQLQAIRLTYAQQAYAAERAIIQAGIAAAQGDTAKIIELKAREVAAEAEYQAQIQAIRAGTADFATKASAQSTEAYIKDLEKQLAQEEKNQELLEKVREQGLEDFRKQTEQLAAKQEKELEKQLQAQVRAYERFVDRVEEVTGDFLFRIFAGQIEGIKQLFDEMKDYFFRVLAQMAAKALAEPLIIPIISSVIGGVGNAVGGLFGASGGGASLLDFLGLAGVANQGLQLTGAMTLLGGVVDSLSSTFTASVNAIINGTDVMTEAFSLAASDLAEFAIPTTGTGYGAVGAATAGVNVLGTAGGLAAVGGGIYGALNANNAASMAAYSASAAAGAFAAASASGLISGIMGAAGVTAATTGWTGFGLIAAAVLSAIGMILDQVISPKGPRLEIGDATGLGVSAAGGQLALTGALETEIQKAERLPGVDAAVVQDDLNRMVMTAFDVMITTINDVALDPTALLGTVTDSLNRALEQMIPVQSSSAENMAKDIEDQLKFIPIQIATTFLDPLIDAFGQLEGVELDQQIQALPVTVGKMASIFTTLRRELDALGSTVANADVASRLAEMYTRLDRFRGQILNETIDLTEAIVDGVIAQTAQALPALLATSAQTMALSLPGFFQQPLQALGSLQGAQAQLEAVGIMDTGPIQDQIARLAASIIEDAVTVMAQAVNQGATAFGDALQVILAIPPAVMALNPVLQQVQATAQVFAQFAGPLHQSMAQFELALTPMADLIDQITGRVDELALAIAEAGTDLATALPLFEQMRVAILAQAEAATDVANQLMTVNAILLDQMNPVDQAAALQAELAPLTAAIEAGTATQAQIEQAVGLSQELIALGQQTDNLALQQEAIQSLEATQALLEEQLLQLTGTTDPQLALVSIQTQALDALKQLNEQMYQLFLSSTAIQQSLGAPATAQTGGLLHLASGGRVPAMLEPGEAVFTPPMTRAQSGALLALNAAYPRFAFGGVVPGSGDGDTVPAFLPAGSVVLNRNATGALRGQGFQSGGRVQDASPFGSGPVHITVDLRGAVFRDKRQRQEVIAEIQDAMKALTNPGQLFRPR
jgi:tape measure domain-containing protein